MVLVLVLATVVSPPPLMKHMLRFEPLILTITLNQEKPPTGVSCSAHRRRRGHALLDRNESLLPVHVFGYIQQQLQLQEYISAAQGARDGKALGVVLRPRRVVTPTSPESGTPKTRCATPSNQKKCPGLAWVPRALVRALASHSRADLQDKRSLTSALPRLPVAIAL